MIDFNRKEVEKQRIWKFADPLDIAVINLHEAGCLEKLSNRTLYIKLQLKIPEEKLIQYHR